MAHKGTSTFILQRASAVLLAPLGVWFLIGVVSHLGAEAGAARAWLANPVNGVLTLAFVAIGAFHMRIGMSEIIADYIHGWSAPLLKILNWLLALALIGASGYAVYTLSFAG